MIFARLDLFSQAFEKVLALGDPSVCSRKR